MAEFIDRLLEAMEKQYRTFAPYRSLCDSQGVSWPDIRAMVAAEDLYAIPAIPCSWFKRDAGRGTFRDLADQRQAGQWHVSSTTSGDPSYVWRTPADMQVVAQSYTEAYRKAPACDKMLAFSAANQFLETVGPRFAIDDHRVDLFALIPSTTAEAVFSDMDALVHLSKARTIWNMIRTLGKGRPVLEVDKEHLLEAIQHAEQNGTKLAFASAVLMLYPAVKALPRGYRLGANAIFVTGAGGWDGKKGTTQGDAIDKADFVLEMCARFSIPANAIFTNFVDLYGTAENGKAQAGFFSPKYGDFVFEVGDDVRIFVVDPEGRLTGEGEQGSPRFVSPYGVEGYAGACLQQNDAITVVALADDHSVRRFTHVTRPSLSGCAYEHAEGVRV
jgi:hypothetical protein